MEPFRQGSGMCGYPSCRRGDFSCRQSRQGIEGGSLDLCFTSPLTRTRQTAELVLGERAKQIPVIVEPRIQEINFGVLEGSRFKDENGTILSEEMKTFLQIRRILSGRKRGKIFQIF